MLMWYWHFFIPENITGRIIPPASVPLYMSWDTRLTWPTPQQVWWPVALMTSIVCLWCERSVVDWAAVAVTAVTWLVLYHTVPDRAQCTNLRYNKTGVFRIKTIPPPPPALTPPRKTLTTTSITTSGTNNLVPEFPHKPINALCMLCMVSYSLNKYNFIILNLDVWLLQRGVWGETQIPHPMVYIMYIRI